MDFEIDYGSFAQKPPAQAPLFASVAGRAGALGNGEVVFVAEADESSHVMTAQVLQAMDQCRSFQPLDRHVAAIESRLPGLRGQGAAVRKVLEGLVARGLLVSDRDFLASFRAEAQDPGEAASEAAIHIRACDRPAQLRRLLDSLAEVVAAHPGRRRFRLVDDSRESGSLREHADMLRRFGELDGVDAEHFEAERWQRAVTRLGDAIPEHREALRWTSDRGRVAERHGGGVGKNLMTLLSAGQCYFQLDDDFSFPLHRHPEYRPGLAFTPAAMAGRSFASRDQALAAGEPVDGDPFALHARLCGRRLGQLAAGVDGCGLDREGLRGLAPSQLAMLDPKVRVLATVNGHRGSPGTGGLAWLYLLDDAGKAGMCASREDYLAALRDPAVWFGSARFLPSRSSGFTPFMVDNRSLTPCTSPHERAEDTLFSALVRVMDPDATFLETPWSIGHVPEQGRDRSGTLSLPESPPIATILRELADRLGPDLMASDPASRLATFAAHLRDLAAMEQPALARYVREFLGYRRSLFIEKLQANLERSKQTPIYWAADLRRLIELNGKALAGRDFGGPDVDSDLYATRLRDELNGLAAALEAWPALWTAARELGPRLLAN